MRVREVAKFYEESGPAMFDKAGLIERFKHGKLHDKKLALRLQKLIGERTGDPMATLGSEHLRTLVMIVMRNVTTDSPWPVSNNPAAKYNDPARKDLPLWQLVRASTAAPTYFPPEVVNVGAHEFIFVDGGVTMYNNPAFQLFLMATVEAYKLAWPAREKEMLLVSIGNGARTESKRQSRPEPDEPRLQCDLHSVRAHVCGQCRAGPPLPRLRQVSRGGADLNREIHNLIDERDLNKGFPGCKGPCEKLFTYLRFNAELSGDGLTRLGVGHLNPKHVQKLDSVQYIPEMQEVGRAVAKKVSIEHFAGFLG